MEVKSLHRTFSRPGWGLNQRRQMNSLTEAKVRIWKAQLRVKTASCTGQKPCRADKWHKTSQRPRARMPDRRCTAVWRVQQQRGRRRGGSGGAMYGDGRYQSLVQCTGDPTGCTAGAQRAGSDCKCDWGLGGARPIQYRRQWRLDGVHPV
jgi:hypothetical protein